MADRNLSADLKSFLPAALEVQEKPPHPAAGWLLRVMAAMVAAAAIWSVFGKVDVVSVAEGKLIPTGNVKAIQPYALGMVSAILVTEGQRVEAGQVLIELDATQTLADEARLLSEWKVAEGKRNRRLALIELLRLPPDEPAGEGEILRHPALDGDPESGRLLLEEYRAMLFQRRALESQIKERRAELAVNRVTMAKHAENMPLAKKRLESL